LPRAGGRAGDIAPEGWAWVRPESGSRTAMARA